MKKIKIILRTLCVVTVVLSSFVDVKEAKAYEDLGLSWWIDAQGIGEYIEGYDDEDSGSGNGSGSGSGSGEYTHDSLDASSGYCYVCEYFTDGIRMAQTCECTQQIDGCLLGGNEDCEDTYNYDVSSNCETLGTC